MRAIIVALALVAIVDVAVADNHTAPMVIAIPTADVDTDLALRASLDVDHRLGSGARASVSYGHLVELSIAGDDHLVTCDPCSGITRVTSAVQQVHAGWKLAIRPTSTIAVAAGVVVPFGSRDGATSAEAFAITTTTLGPVRLHLGASAWASRHTDARGAEIVDGGIGLVRPMTGLEWTPTIYPRTTLLLDMQWLPQLGPTAAQTQPRWLFAWGVRYRALAWSAVELAVKFHQGDDLGGATVMMRVTARWPRR
jgi:hypothetical protein